MRVVKIVVIIIVVVVAAFFGNGMLNGTVSYDAEVTIHAPITTTWDVMNDEKRVSEWLKDIDRMELVSGKPDEVGAVSHIYVIQNGEEMMMEETITALTPYQHIAMTFTMDFMDMDYAMTLSEKDGVTTVKSSSVTRGNGIFAKSILALMPSAMKQQEETNLNNLKLVVEAE
jgi:uncharacterized protein YndB with AHSA1/START domain